MRVVAIDHVALRVTDLPGTSRFYQQVMGCVLERHRPDLGMAQLRVGDALVDLIASNGPLGRADQVARNMDHLCFRVADFEPDALLREIEAAGMTGISKRPRYGSTDEAVSIHARDPENNGLEFRA